jgi:hypothetical protein
MGKKSGAGVVPGFVCSGAKQSAKGRFTVLRAFQSLFARATVVLAVCGVALAGAATASAQQVTQDGSASVIATTDGFGGLDFYWQPIGGSQSFQSTHEQVAPDGTLSQQLYPKEPSIAVVGNETVIAAQGAQNNLVVYEQPIYAVPPGSGENGCCTGPWHADPNPFAGFGTTFSEPSIAALSNNTVVIAAQGLDNSLQFYWQTVGTTTWHAIQAAPTYSIAGDPQIAIVGGNPVIAALGDGNSRVDFWHENWRTSTWSSSPQWVADAYTNRDPAITATGNGVAIAAVTAHPGSSTPSNVNIGYYTEAIGSGSWTSQTVFPSTSNVWSSSTAPSLAQVGGSVVLTDMGEYFFDGCGGTPHSWWEPVGGSQWSNPQEVDCYDYNSISPASIAQVGSSAVVFDPDQNGGEFYWEGIGSSTWSRPQIIAGP